jgi:hypothetical protein
MQAGLTELLWMERVGPHARRTMACLLIVKQFINRLECGWTYLIAVFGIAVMMDVVVLVELFTQTIVQMSRGTLISPNVE